MSPMAFFTMSKTKTIAWAVFCVVLAMLFAFIHLGIFSIGALTYAGFLSCIAAYKIVRDRGIISNARIADSRAVLLPPPSMGSPDSNGRLFVPPPIDRR